MRRKLFVQSTSPFLVPAAAVAAASGPLDLDEMFRIQTSPLAYPAGVAPGYNASSCPVQAVTMSCVSTGGNMLDVLRGGPGTLVGSNMTGGIFREGAGTTFTTTVEWITFPFPNTTNPQGMSAAAIFTRTATGSNDVILTSGDDFIQGCGLSISGSQMQADYINVGSATFPLNSIVNGQPYFAAASFHTSATYAVLKNLNTGILLTMTTTGGDTRTSGANSKCKVGAENFANWWFHGRIHAGLIARAPTSLQTLISLADNPWSLWYPRAF